MSLMSQASRAPTADSNTPGAKVSKASRGATEPHDQGEAMNYLRRMQTERPVIFWVAMALAFWLAFQLVLSLVALLLGPFGFPSWAPIAAVLAVLVVIARRQQSR